MPAPIAALLLGAALLLTATAPVHAATVTVAGSGGMIPLLSALASVHMKKHPGDIIKVNPTSLTQSGGILAAKTGAVDIGMSARPLEARELSFSIEAFHIADVPAAVAVHRNVPVRNLTSQQLCAIYAGKITNWRELGGRNAPIVVLTRPESDSTKMAFREGIPCMRQLIETPHALSMYKSQDMLSALQQTPDAIGIIDAIALEQQQGKALPVKLDGRSASAEEVASGRWPVVKKYTLVLRTDRSKAVNRFMRFIASPAGAAVIKSHGGVPTGFSFP
jgi:phosphate transport system substrate-binding protein